MRKVIRSVEIVPVAVATINVMVTLSDEVALTHSYIAEGVGSFREGVLQVLGEQLPSAFLQDVHFTKRNSREGYVDLGDLGRVSFSAKDRDSYIEHMLAKQLRPIVEAELEDTLFGGVPSAVYGGMLCSRCME